MPPRPQILSLPERLDAHPDYAGRGVTMGFVDVGFYPHPDLVRPERRIRALADVTRATPRPERFYVPEVFSWHGTMTACCAAGSGYLSGARYRGLASEAQVVLIRAGTDDGRVVGRHIAAGIRFAARHPDLGIRVLNVSVGVDRADPDEPDVLAAVREAVAAGIVVVAAAGNTPGAPPEAPAAAPEAITVGGADDQNTRRADDDAVWPSSSSGGREGAAGASACKPDLLAPAIWVPAPMLPGTLQSREAAALYGLLGVAEEVLDEQLFAREMGRGVSDADAESARALLAALESRVAHQKYISPDYQHVDGTSFGAPIVASVVAQMLEASPGLGPADVRRGLTETARALPDVPRVVQGAGVLAPRRAVEWALRKRG